MADETAAAVAVTPNGNGTARYRTAVLALSFALGVSILLEGGLGIALLYYPPPADAGPMVSRLVDNLSQLGVMLAGGLLALSRPQQS